MGFHSYRGDFLKGYDRYAKGISLTYMRSGSYRTGAGGICSIISFCLLFYWVCVNVFFSFYNHGTYTTSASSSLTQNSAGVYPLYEITIKEFLISYDIVDITADPASPASDLELAKFA